MGVGRIVEGSVKCKQEEKQYSLKQKKKKRKKRERTSFRQGRR